MKSSDSTIYFDTTTIVDYIIKGDRRAAIEAETSKYDRLAALHYVKMEIKRGVLQYLVYLHNKLVACGSWAEVQQAITQLSNTPQRNRLGTILETLAEFWKK